MRDPLTPPRQASTTGQSNVVLVTFLLQADEKECTSWDALKNITIFGPNNKSFSPLEVEENGATSFCMAFPIPDTVSPLKTAIQQFEDLTKLTYSSGFLRILVGTPFIIPITYNSPIHSDSLYASTPTKIHPFLFNINRNLAISQKPAPTAAFKSITTTTPLIDIPTPGILNLALKRCTISPLLETSINRLRNDHTSGAGRLANLAVKEFASLCYDPDLISLPPSEWWSTLRLYGWHLFHARPSMSSSIQNCIVRILQHLQLTLLSSLDATYSHSSPCTHKTRADLASSTILSTLSLTRTKSYSMPALFTTYLLSLPSFTDALHQNKLYNILIHSNSSLLTSSLINLFHHPSRPRIRIFVLESRPLLEGVTLARTLKAAIPPLSAGLPAVSVEIAVDAAVGNYTKVADLYILAADRIYPNGDVSNKIGCLAAVLGMRFNARRGGEKKVVVIGATDKICGRDERERGWDWSYEENDGAEVKVGWPTEGGEVAATCTGEEEDDDVRVRNMYFETVPAEFVDCYLTEEGVMSVEGVGEVADLHAAREREVFAEL